ncbi:MAG: helix-turn-helix domain-containing protein [Treponema sp.]|nr:helix-turn-helix domain-containing protein [Treponema sp.]
MGFKENLKAELSYVDMRVKDLAKLSGVKKQTIDSYLREDSYTPSVENAVNIARALGVSVEYLVTGLENKQKSKVYPQEYPLEALQIASIAAKLSEKNRKMAVSIIESIKKHEDKEKMKAG